ncbi:MAG: hypothetical protein DI626_02925 [Micavibrio aeruginosavorus]|uniref:Uncharacterized protein n=1 Tax=Micavibrio aeruginosavorus TaxID=349221 RepID=A0A2W5A032_9BACT|nr:MAG: hypothetical protein DI626_02925 [Micavibrio aeruginosavorus]
MLESLSPKNVLSRGFAIVRAPDGSVLSDAEAAAKHQEMLIEFRGEQRVPVRKA